MTGSQGEPNAALSRITINDHRYVRLTERDRVVMSARAIPGNEQPIGQLLAEIMDDDRGIFPYRD